MKKFLSQSIAILMACLVLFMGSCIINVAEDAKATSDPHSQQLLTSDTLDNLVVEKSGHEHSQGNHCMRETSSAAFQRVSSIQTQIFEKLGGVLASAINPLEKIHTTLITLYESKPIAQNSFQGHIRSVLIRV